MQYEQENINLEVVNAFKSFIFNPSAPQTDISFSDWDALLGKLAELPGIKQILFPGDTPVTIPPGTYDMTDIVLCGETPFAAVIADDVVFQNLSKICDMTMTIGGGPNPTTTSNLIYNDGAGHRITFDGVTIFVNAFAAFPFIDVSAGTTLLIHAKDSAFLSTNPATPVMAIDATSSVGATSFAGVAGNSWGGGFGADPFVVVAGGGTFTLNVTTGDVFWAQNNPAGPTLVVRDDDYEEAVLADWAGVRPLNVKTALDRIAALVGPVP